MALFYVRYVVPVVTYKMYYLCVQIGLLEESALSILMVMIFLNYSGQQDSVLTYLASLLSSGSLLHAAGYAVTQHRSLRGV